MVSLGCSVLVCPHTLAQGSQHLAISYSATAFNTEDNCTNGKITCVVKPGAINKHQGKVGFYLYARNDVRDIPMELLKNMEPVCPKRIKTRKRGNPNIVFLAMANDLFYTGTNTKGFSWKWKGRARAPLSPLVTSSGEKVSRIDCWFVLHTDNKTYTSDTISIRVQ